MLFEAPRPAGGAARDCPVPVVSRGGALRPNNDLPPYSERGMWGDEGPIYSVRPPCCNGVRPRPRLLDVRGSARAGGDTHPNACDRCATAR